MIHGLQAAEEYDAVRGRVDAALASSLDRAFCTRTGYAGCDAQGAVVPQSRRVKSMVEKFNNISAILGDEDAIPCGTKSSLQSRAAAGYAMQNESDIVHFGST